MAKRRKRNIEHVVIVDLGPDLDAALEAQVAEDERPKAYHVRHALAAHLAALKAAKGSTVNP